MLHALIMAGGSGTRFWPASRSAHPKQILPLVSDRTMVQETVARLGQLVGDEQILVMTNESLIKPIAAQLPQLKTNQIVGEPCRRDTAPCIGLAAELMQAEDPDATMLVLPADHIIETHEQFRRAVQLGNALIEEDPERIVTFGIPPTYPAESFGYVQAAEAIAMPGEERAFRVERFREKPDRERAAEYLRAGNYYWNSGIFMWKAATVLAALREREPEMARHLHSIGQSAGMDHFDEVLRNEFAAIKGKSIDYAVMEHYDNVVVIEAPFSWDDVGSWQALSRMQAADESGNTVRGSHVGIDTSRCIIQSAQGHTIVTIDVEDLIVVHTPDATLIAPKAAEERVREAVAELKTRGLEHLL